MIRLSPVPSSAPSTTGVDSQVSGAGSQFIPLHPSISVDQAAELHEELEWAAVAYDPRTNENPGHINDSAATDSAFGMFSGRFEVAFTLRLCLPLPLARSLAVTTLGFAFLSSTLCDTMDAKLRAAAAVAGAAVSCHLLAALAVFCLHRSRYVVRRTPTRSFSCYPSSDTINDACGNESISFYPSDFGLNSGFDYETSHPQAVRLARLLEVTAVVTSSLGCIAANIVAILCHLVVLEPNSSSAVPPFMFHITSLRVDALIVAACIALPRMRKGALLIVLIVASIALVAANTGVMIHQSHDRRATTSDPWIMFLRNIAVDVAAVLIGAYFSARRDTEMRRRRQATVIALEQSTCLQLLHRRMFAACALALPQATYIQREAAAAIEAIRQAMALRVVNDDSIAGQLGAPTVASTVGCVLVLELIDWQVGTPSPQHITSANRKALPVRVGRFISLLQKLCASSGVRLVSCRGLIFEIAAGLPGMPFPAAPGAAQARLSSSATVCRVAAKICQLVHDQARDAYGFASVRAGVASGLLGAGYLATSQLVAWTVTGPARDNAKVLCTAARPGTCYVCGTTVARTSPSAEALGIVFAPCPEATSEFPAHILRPAGPHQFRSIPEQRAPPDDRPCELPPTAFPSRTIDFDDGPTEQCRSVRHSLITEPNSAAPTPPPPLYLQPQGLSHVLSAPESPCERHAMSVSTPHEDDPLDPDGVVSITSRPPITDGAGPRFPRSQLMLQAALTRPVSPPPRPSPCDPLKPAAATEEYHAMQIHARLSVASRYLVLPHLAHCVLFASLLAQTLVATGGEDVIAILLVAAALLLAAYLAVYTFVRESVMEQRAHKLRRFIPRYLIMVLSVLAAAGGAVQGTGQLGSTDDFEPIAAVALGAVAVLGPLVVLAFALESNRVYSTIVFMWLILFMVGTSWSINLGVALGLAVFASFLYFALSYDVMVAMDDDLAHLATGSALHADAREWSRHLRQLADAAIAPDFVAQLPPEASHTLFPPIPPDEVEVPAHMFIGRRFGIAYVAETLTAVLVIRVEDVLPLYFGATPPQGSRTPPSNTNSHATLSSATSDEGVVWQDHHGITPEAIAINRRAIVATWAALDTLVTAVFRAIRAAESGWESLDPLDDPKPRGSAATRSTTAAEVLGLAQRARDRSWRSDRGGSRQLAILRVEGDAIVVGLPLDWATARTSVQLLTVPDSSEDVRLSPGAPRESITPQTFDFAVPVEPPTDQRAGFTTVGSWRCPPVEYSTDAAAHVLNRGAGKQYVPQPLPLRKTADVVGTLVRVARYIGRCQPPEASHPPRSLLPDPDNERIPADIAELLALQRPDPAFAASSVPIRAAVDVGPCEAVAAGVDRVRVNYMSQAILRAQSLIAHAPDRSLIVSGDAVKLCPSLARVRPRHVIPPLATGDRPNCLKPATFPPAPTPPRLSPSSHAASALELDFHIPAAHENVWSQRTVPGDAHPSLVVAV
jgi:class 3 adenylate cyclase